MKKKLSIEEIKKKLEWFHGEEFNKYPFINPEDKKDNKLNEAC